MYVQLQVQVNLLDVLFLGLNNQWVPQGIFWRVANPLPVSGKAAHHAFYSLLLM